MKLVLDIKNNSSHVIPDKKLIRDSIYIILKEKNMVGNFEVALEIVSEKKIQLLNHKFLKKDFPTDVLSFPIYEKPPSNLKKTVLLGDIFVCYEKIAQNAAGYGLSVEEEFIKMIKHSGLHLLGCHHK